MLWLLGGLSGEENGTGKMRKGGLPRRGWPEEGHNAWGWRQQPWNDQWQDDWDLNSHDYMPGGLPEEGRETQRERSPSPRHIPTSQTHSNIPEAHKSWGVHKSWEECEA